VSQAAERRNLRLALIGRLKAGRYLSGSTVKAFGLMTPGSNQNCTTVLYVPFSVDEY
jgi:hypothetical protein